MIKGEKQIGKLGAYNRLTLTSKSSLTGMRITADKPVSVVSGANTEKLMYIEQMTPTETWGKIYLFPIKRASPESLQVVISVMADTSSTPTVDVKIVVKHGKKETANKSLRITSHQGVSHNLKSAQGLVAVVGSSPIHVLFALQSKSMMRKSKSKALQEGFHMWLALAPVEQYFPDPCLLAQQCNVITLLVGLKASTYENVKKNGNLTTGTTRLELDPFWVLMVPNFMFKEINKDKDLIGPNMTSPLWYYNVHVIQRDMRFMFIVDDGSRLSALNHAQATLSMQEGDRVDNDGDGLVDEELKNDKDDDGDGKSDEDLYNTTDLECLYTPNVPELMYTKEYSYYRHERYYLLWDKAKDGPGNTDGLEEFRNWVFAFCISGAVVCAVIFFPIVWLIDKFLSMTARESMSLS
nr:hypothetical protein BaRGS_007647 [Batillaria attramentaria]